MCDLIHSLHVYTERVASRFWQVAQTLMPHVRNLTIEGLNADALPALATYLGSLVGPVRVMVVSHAASARCSARDRLYEQLRQACKGLERVDVLKGRSCATSLSD